jgi:NAD(P)-dependent dehydrogenase (short-subunit alcohol dehydrogenase family)
VTGGTQGIGAAVATRLSEAGATVLIAARKRPTDLARDHMFVAADVATVEGCATVANAAMEKLGGIDIVVHVVGGSSAPGGGFAVLDELAEAREIAAKDLMHASGARKFTVRPWLVNEGTITIKLNYAKVSFGVS